MARTKISEFSSTAASNTDIDGINIAEGCAPSGINDAIRELMSQLKDWQSGASNDPYVIGSSGSLTLNQGTANGVLYLNGSKVATSGSTLQFDGSGKLALGNVAHTSFIPTTSLTLGNSGANAEIRMGQADTSALISKWVYNATVGNAYGAIETYGQSNYIQFGASDFRWQVASSEQMRLTSTGLGIGTSSPDSSVRLTVAKNDGIIQIQRATGTAYPFSFGIASDGRFNIYNSTTASESLAITQSGNLGLGVTPSAWNASSKAFQFGSTGKSAIENYNGANTQVLFNAYRNSGGSYIYTTSDYAQAYSMNNTGVHAWYTAQSGTAGNAITFTQALTLDASGNLLLNTTSQNGSAKLTVRGASGGSDCISAVQQAAGGYCYVTQAFSSGGTYYHALFQAGATSVGSITSSSSLTLYNTTSDQRLKENIVDAPEFGSVIDSIKVRSYDWKADGNHQRAGFIAQELVTVAPEAVHQPADPEEMMAVDYSKLVPMLVKEIQSLRKRLADAGIA